MKRLILKDFLNLKLTTLLLIPCYGLWAIGSGYFTFNTPSESMVSLTSIGIISFLLIGRSAFYYDETSTFDKYLSAMPIPKFTIVASRYMVCLLTSILGIFSSTLLAKLYLSQSSIPAGSITVAFLVNLLFMAILMPPLYRFGYLKSRYILMIITILAITLAPVVAKIPWITGLFINPNRPQWVLISILILITYGALTFSLQLSTRIFSNREF